jgi:hypothetical protein
MSTDYEEEISRKISLRRNIGIQSWKDERKEKHFLKDKVDVIIICSERKNLTFWHTGLESQHPPMAPLIDRTGPKSSTNIATAFLRYPSYRSYCNDSSSIFVISQSMTAFLRYPSYRSRLRSHQALCSIFHLHTISPTVHPSSQQTYSNILQVGYRRNAVML